MKKWKLGGIIGGLIGLIFSLYFLIFVGIVPFTFIIFPVIFGFILLIAEYALETEKYWEKGAIAGFLIPFVIFEAASFNRGIDRYYNDLMWLLLILPVAIIICTIIGYLIDKYTNSRKWSKYV